MFISLTYHYKGRWKLLKRTKYFWDALQTHCLYPINILQESILKSVNEVESLGPKSTSWSQSNSICYRAMLSKRLLNISFRG